jgi:hypothetical protein
MSEEKDEFESLRNLNALVYDRPTVSALISRRQVKINNFTAQQFELGDTMICVNNVQDCVYGPTSTLKLDFNLVVTTATTTPAAIFGVNGSILNIFESIRVSHRSGEQLSYLQQAGVWATIQRFYAVNPSASAQLEGLLNTGFTSGTVALTVGTYPMTVQIPLWLFLGEFANSQQIMPAALIAGLRMEWKLNSLVNSLCSVNGNITAIRPSLLLDCCAPYDSVEKTLMMEQADASKSGLQYSFYSPFQTNASIGGSAISFDIQQASTICETAHAVFRSSADLNSQSASKMNFQNVLSVVQWRLASIYYPNQQIIVAPPLNRNALEPYYTTLTAWNGMPNQQMVKTAGQGANVPYSVGSPDTNGSFTASSGSWGNGGLAVYSQTLDRSPVSSSPYSGQSTNNSRLLVFLATKDASAPGAVDRCDVFAVSLRVANLFSDSCVLDR